MRGLLFRRHSACHRVARYQGGGGGGGRGGRGGRLRFVDMLRLIQKLEYRQREKERRGDHRNANSSQQRNPGDVHRDLLVPLPQHKPLRCSAFGHLSRLARPALERRQG